MADAKPRSRIASWVPAMLAGVSAFAFGLMTCGMNDWHAPPPAILGSVVIATVLLGAVSTYGREELARRPAINDPVLRAASTTRLSFYAAMSVIACLAALATIGFALAIQDVERVRASVLAATWLGAVPVLQTLAQYAIERTASLGTDAMRVRGRLVPLRNVRAVSRERSTLSLQVGDRETISVPLHDDAVAAVFVARLRAQLEGRAVVPAQLERAGRSIEAWKKDLTKADHGYRDGQLTPEHAEEVLASPTASGEERVGAALVLTGAGKVDRVRIAANSCVDRRVRVALLRAADGSLGDREIDALEENRVTTAVREIP